ncbi:MAG: CvpA family protein [Fibromonadaceae bacterium]|jgi:membrane protein required for colicin V production|nr:CvpA family protein [Fibromonadaceae bacterium]
MFIDIAVLLLVIIFLGVGIMHGLIVSLLYLAAWIVGILCAWLFSGAFAAMLSANIAGLAPLLSLCIGAVVAFLLPFILIRIAASVADFFIKKSTPITMINRLLGGVFGILKGIAVATVVLTVIHFLPAQGNLKQTRDSSTAYSVYKAIPFAKLWDDFKVETEGTIQKI